MANWFSFWHQLPIWLRIIVALFGLGLLIVVGFLMFLTVSIILYERTDEFVLVDLTSGSNRLEIKLVANRYAGGTSRGHRLYWNGKLVSNRGGIGSGGQPDEPFPIDPDDQKGLIAKTVADTIGLSQWTIWVNPAQFSRADFDALTAILTTQMADIDRQLKARSDSSDADTPTSGYQKLFQIGQVVYGDATRLKPRVYTWKPDWRDKFDLTIEPDGRVDLRDDNRSSTVGQVRLAGGQRVLEWTYEPESFILSTDWPRFRNEAGQSLADRYVLRHNPGDNFLFFRRTPAYIETVYIINPDNPAYTITQEAKYVRGAAYDVKSPILRQYYDAGTTQYDSTGTTKPVFVWKPWPEHPFTEADLRQFQNEQGQRLGDLYDLRPAPADGQ